MKHARLWAVLLVACNGGSDPIATLLDHAGEVERDRVGSLRVWASVAEETTFAIGEGIRTGVEGTARVRLRNGQGLAIEESTVVRFSSTRPDGPPGIELEEGAIELEEGTIETALGVAHIEGRTRLVATEDGLVFEVRVGRARLETGDEDPLVIAAGERFIDGATEPTEPTEPAPVDEPEPPVVEPTFAVTADISGSVQVRGPNQALVPLEGPTGLPEGSTLTLSEGGRAGIQRGAERLEVTGVGELVVGGEIGPLVSAASGELEVRSVERDVEVRVPGGVLRMRSRTRAHLTLEEQRTGVRIIQGSAEIGDEALEAGEETQLALGGAPPMRFSEPAASADLVLPLGSTTTVHATEPPVRIRFGGECAELTVSVGARNYRGASAVNVELTTGGHRYASVCDGERKTGRVRIVRDAAQRRLPRTPPRTTVDVDGRSYTVLYQNRLPVITVRWRGAPPGPYTLRAIRGAQTQTHQTVEPHHTFTSGAVSEGVTRFRFETEEGRHSPESSLRVGFDNAARGVFIESPGDGEAAAGVEVRIAGNIRRGARVGVGSQRFELDRHWRFAASVTPPNDVDSLALLVEYPSGARHHYLRRLR